MTSRSPAPVNPVPFWLIIPAAGSGKRMGENKPKQYQMLAGQAVLQRTLDVFLPLAQLKGVLVAIPAGDTGFSQLPAARHPLVTTVVGGKERADSVRHALQFLEGKADAQDWVLVHDAARPCVEAADVVAMLAALADTEAGGIMAVPVSDTLKRASAEGAIDHTEDRRSLWQAQTPQMFRFGLLLKALQQASSGQYAVTDESSAVEQLGYRPHIFQGKRSNIKITLPEDMVLAENILAESGRGASNMNSSRTVIPRTGHGYDVHRFAPEAAGSSIVLGGVNIPHNKKLLAHSDGDVAIHALCDALLGALALGDIGKHFPDTDSRYKNIDSRQLLRHVVKLLHERDHVVGNVDMTVVAQLPKILPHVAAMRANLAVDMGISVDAVNVKATTTEKLGFEGREEGISCHAIAVILPRG